MNDIDVYEAHNRPKVFDVRININQANLNDRNK